jgi:hypothetical protein
MSEPHQPPRPPEFTPGQATPPPYEPPPEYPPTSQFPPVNYAPPGHSPDYGQGGYPPPGQGGYPPPDQGGYPPPDQGGYPPPGYGQPGYPPQPGYPGHTPPPRRSNKPMIAVIIAVAVLLCGGVITSGVLLVNRATDKVQEVAEPILNPTLPALPTDMPTLPGLPTDLPAFPTDLPGLPQLDEGQKITVTYEVEGDGPANIVYAERLGETPKVLDNVDLPWKVTTEMQGAAFVSIIAQRLGTDEGTITCRASIDGDEVAEQTTKGAVATTTCNKLVFN